MYLYKTQRGIILSENELRYWHTEGYSTGNKPILTRVKDVEIHNMGRSRNKFDPTQMTP